MKKSFVFILLAALPLGLFAQSTEGTDFWVTFLKADQNNTSDNVTLSLSVASKTNCSVTISNPYTGYTTTKFIQAGAAQQIEIYNGTPDASSARSSQDTEGNVCYSVNSEVADTCALHVTSTAPISLYAANYKNATFDASNILPTASLRDDYFIQCYSPSDHQSKPQGSHFAIVATEDNTVVEITPSVATQEHGARSTFRTDTLQKGQVYYVLSQQMDWTDADLSGTHVKALDYKKIAVFQGCPHTNIPYMVRQRDHIYSQAMPTQYWGTQFVVTASLGRNRDKIRVMALTDSTEVRVNGKLVHTFGFTEGAKGDNYCPWDDSKQYFEFEIGAKVAYCADDDAKYYYDKKSSDPNIKAGKLPEPLVIGDSCIIETSCPCAVHEFLVSQQYGNASGSNGDPAMLWVNPIEQQIDKVTFTSYESAHGATSHYVNVVTANKDGMTLDKNPIANQFHSLGKIDTTNYYFARISLGTNNGVHTLENTQGQFIGQAYGFTKNESYGYSVGGMTKDLTPIIIINEDTFSLEKPDTLCGNEIVNFKCQLEYRPDSIRWGFGDGTPDTVVTEVDTIKGLDGKIKSYSSKVVPHYYAKDSTYYAYAIIYREHDDDCYGEAERDSIPIRVFIGRLRFWLDTLVTPCGQNAQLHYTNLSGTPLTEDGFYFDEKTKGYGFTDESIVLNEAMSRIEFPIPSGISDEQRMTDTFRIYAHVANKCDTVDTYLPFKLPLTSNVIMQRNDHVIGLKDSTAAAGDLSEFQWYRDSVLIPDQSEPILIVDPINNTSNYYICFYNKKTKERKCSCPFPYNAPTDTLNFAANTYVMATCVNAGSSLRVDVASESAQGAWYGIDGSVVAAPVEMKAGPNYLTAPSASGIYILRIVAEKTTSHKIIVK